MTTITGPLAMTTRDGRVLMPGTPEFDAYREAIQRDLQERYGVTDPQAAFASPEAPPALGWKTAADLVYGPPPQPALDVFFTTDSALVLYGPGGVGKGTIACLLILWFLRAFDTDVYVLDFEGHESEWGNRLRGLGLTEEELRRVHYREPFGVDWEGPRGSLREAAILVRDELTELNIGLVVVDSIVMASDGDAAMGGAAAAKDYFAALATMGRRSLNLAHVAGGAEKWPDKPFGSTYVHNLARETWAIERVSDEEEQVPFDPLVVRNVSTFRVELRNRKNSEGPVQRPVTFDISYFANGDLTIEKVEQTKAPKDYIRESLTRTPGLTVEAIVKAVKEDSGTVLSQKQVTNALTKHKDVFVIANGDKRPFTYRVS